MLTDKDKLFDSRWSRVMARLNARHQPTDTTNSAPAKSAPATPIDTFLGMKTMADRFLETSTAEDGLRLNEDLDAMQSFLNERGAEMPSYDFRRASDLLAELRRAYDQLRSAGRQATTATFAFSQKTANATTLATGDAVVSSGVNSGESNNAIDSTVAKMLELQVDLSGVSNECRSIIDCRDKDVLLSESTGCRISVLDSPSTLHLANLVNCTVVSFPVRTSVFVENCVDCTIAVGCQQLRVHSSRSLNIYLHVTSGAIIENCGDVRLAPYSVDGVKEQQFWDIDLDFTKNVWDRVQDFDWLSKSPSPNWSVIPEEERKKLSLVN